MGIDIAEDPAGYPIIAYHELDSYAFPSQGNLKVVYQRLQLYLPLTLKE
jgi:hypothetical protein